MSNEPKHEAGPHPNPLPDYRERGQGRRTARRAVVTGAIVFIVSVVLMFAPLLLGRNGFNKYLVAFGFVGVFAGLSFMLHGAVDWLRSRK